MSHPLIYVLRLKTGRFYVGKTVDIASRIHQHLSGKGAAWTKKYPPIGFERVYKSPSPFDEDKITKEYMSIHGIDYVRGGTYVQVDLDCFERQFIQREIWSAFNRCKRCGNSGHFEKDCFAFKDVNGDEIN